MPNATDRPRATPRRAGWLALPSERVRSHQDRWGGPCLQTWGREDHERRGAPRRHTCRCAVTLLPLLLAALTAPTRAAPAASQPTSRPARGPENLVVNGTFERAAKTAALPHGWTTKHPDNVRRVKLDRPRGHVVQMTGDAGLMGTYGIDLTGNRIPIKPNVRYRCTGVTRSTGPNLIVFVKGYATVTRRVKGKVKTFDDTVYQMRKEIPPSPDWRPFNLDFDIKPALMFSDFQHKVEYVRITLWAYWPAGTCGYDDIRFEEVGPIPGPAVLHRDAVTHVGRKPHLALGSAPAGAPFDEEQTWIDAVNAWKLDHYAKALELTERLVAHAPHKGTYRILAARTLVKLSRWPEADQHARWFLDKPAEETADPKAREVEPWQQEWATVVHAEVLINTGHADQAKSLLERTLDTFQSPHARQAARNLLDK